MTVHRWDDVIALRDDLDDPSLLLALDAALRAMSVETSIENAHAWASTVEHERDYLEGVVLKDLEEQVRHLEAHVQALEARPSVVVASGPIDTITM